MEIITHGDLISQLQATDMTADGDDDVDLISKLPTDILEHIFKLLGSNNILDHLHFGAVCVRWRKIALQNQNHGGLSCLRPPPMMMLPVGDAADDDGETCEFFRLSDSKISRLSVPEIHQKKWCFGSSLGWIMTLDEETKKLNLVNPFSSNWAHITLPSLDMFSCLQNEDDNDSHRSFIKKFVLSKSPGGGEDEEEDDYVVMTIASYLNKLFFYRPGQDRWTEVDYDGFFTPFEDFAYYRGKFYCVGWDGALLICNVIELDGGGGYHLKATRLLPGDHDSGRKRYLVASSSELLEISRSEEWVEDDDDDDDDDDDEWWGREITASKYYTAKIEVFKLDEGVLEWKPVSSLGDRSIFIGMNASFSVRAADFPGYCMPNCIYFTDNHYDYDWCSDDMGVYSLEDGKIENLYPNRPVFAKPTIWVSPNPWSGTCGR